MVKGIWTVSDIQEERFLRKKAVDFDFSAHTRKDIEELIRTMRTAMKRADGIGLSANQIGLSHRAFVASVPGENGRAKFYAIFNPTLVVVGTESEELEEGCLSVPGAYGPTERAYRVILTGQDKHGKPVKIKAWGLLARVFQHECDHLNGALFIDHARYVETITK